MADIFDRSGVAARSDLSSGEWEWLFRLLEAEQERFRAREHEWRSPQYAWYRDPLHCWSRAWEYPYAFHHLRRWREQWRLPRQPRVVDLGSGVTFFPFAIARLGCHVTCLDNDPVCGEDLPKAAAAVDHQPGKIDFRLVASERLPLDDGEADAVYCISVLEHVPDPAQMVDEVTRILAPGGLFVLTIDLDLRGNVEIGPEGHARLVAELRSRFEFVHPQTVIHPRDHLTTLNSIFPERACPRSLPGAAWFYTKQWAIKPLLGRKPAKRLMLSVQAFVLKAK